MSAIFSKLLSTVLVPVLNWLWDKVSYLIVHFVKLGELKDVQTKRDEQAEKVQKISDEIKALVLANQPVPESLKEKFRAENNKLLDISYNAK